MKFRGFYFITDHSLSCNGNIRDVELALNAGVRIVQYREKNRELSEYYQEMYAVRSLCRRAGAVFIVNDSLELALRLNADGLHVGQEDISCTDARHVLKHKIIGLSIENISQAKEAERCGVDYVGVGAVFPTQTKQKSTPSIGLHTLHEIKSSIKLPVVAIGGITFENAHKVLNTHIDMICAISASLKDGCVYENVKTFQQLFQ